MRRQISRRIGVLAGLVIASLVVMFPGAARAVDIEGFEVDFHDRAVTVTFQLANAFPEQILEHLDAGLEISFESVVRLRRRRRRFFDKTVSERYVVVSARYSNLTRMYKLTRRVDGNVTDSELTDNREIMRTWMTRIEAEELFGERDLETAGTYYLRVRSKLLGRFKLLFIPADIETEWVESSRFKVATEEP